MNSSDPNPNATRSPVTQADTVKIKECRIVYRRTGLNDKPPGDISAAGLNPTRSVVPNDVEQ